MPVQLWVALATAALAALLLAAILAGGRANRRRQRVREAAHRLVESDLLTYDISNPLNRPPQRPSLRRVLVCLQVETRPPHTYVLDPAGRQGISFGRDPRCEVCLSEVIVSGQHCRIYWDGRAVVLQDLGSSNGTQVRRGLFRRWQLQGVGLPLQNNDRFWVGHTAFRVWPFLYDDTLM